MTTDTALNTPPRKKVKQQSYSQAFCDEWLTDSELKEWVKPDSNNRYAAICTICSCTLTNTNKTGLLAHKTTQKHMKNVEAKSKTLNIKKLFNKPKEPYLQDKVAKAETLLTASMAEHNTPFSQADHLITCNSYTTDFDRFKTIIAICEKIAQIVAKSSTTESYVQRETILTRLEEYWKNDCDVTLSVVTSVPQLTDGYHSTSNEGLTSTNFHFLTTAVAVGRMKERNREIDLIMSFDVDEPGRLVKIEDDGGANCLSNVETCEVECSNKNVCYTTKRTRQYSSDDGNQGMDDDEDYLPQPQSHKKGKNNSVPTIIKSFSFKPSETAGENLRQSSRRRVNRKSPDVVENATVVVVEPETSILDDVVQSVVDETEAELRRGKNTSVCETCNVTFVKSADLRKHFKVQHAHKVNRGTSSEFTCKVCNMSFKSADVLKKHRLIHDRSWSCHLCGLKFAHEYRFRNHIDSHDVALDLKCSMCETDFSSYASLRAHAKHHKNKHVCNECQSTFPYRCKLRKHMKRKHSKELPAKVYYNELLQPIQKLDETLPSGESAEDAQKVSIVLLPGQNVVEKLSVPKFSAVKDMTSISNTGGNNMPLDDQSNTLPMKNLNTHSCTFCKKRFSSFVILSKHIKLEHRHWVCRICNMTFSSKYLLKDHGRMHGICLNLKCSSCEEEFTNYAMLVEHGKVHRNNHKCRECGVVFSFQYQLNIHVKKSHFLKLHEIDVLDKVAEEPSESVCPIEFSNGHYGLHLNQREGLQVGDDKIPLLLHTDSSEKPNKKSTNFVCTVCNRQFLHRSGLKKHVQTHDKRWLCQVCSRVFAHSHELKDHMDLHEVTHSLKCLSCDIEFTSYSQLIEHSKTHKNKHRCKYCDTTFSHLNRLKYHMVKMHFCKSLLTAAEDSKIHPTPVDSTSRVETLKNDLFSCVDCDRCFASRPVLDRHIRTHNMKHECPVCNAKFPFEGKLLRHMDSHGIQQNLKCLSCDEQFDSYLLLKLHYKTHAGDYKCRECYEVFDMRYKLKNHVFAKHTDKKQQDSSIRPYMCSTCGKCFREPSTFRSHMVIHEAVKHYRCTLCDKAYFQTSGLRDHMMLHKGFKPHMCNTCGLTFARPNQLRSHMRLHTGERPFSCEICERKFRTSAELRKHSRIHSNEKTYECQVCKEMFKTMNSRQRHMTSHSQQFLYSCSICEKRFIEDRNLKAHIRTHFKTTAGTDECVRSIPLS